MTEFCMEISFRIHRMKTDPLHFTICSKNHFRTSTKENLLQLFRNSQSWYENELELATSDISLNSVSP